MLTLDCDLEDRPGSLTIGATSLHFASKVDAFSLSLRFQGILSIERTLQLQDVAICVTAATTTHVFSFPDTEHALRLLTTHWRAATLHPPTDVDPATDDAPNGDGAVDRAEPNPDASGTSSAAAAIEQTPATESLGVASEAKAEATTAATEAESVAEMSPASTGTAPLRRLGSFLRSAPSLASATTAVGSSGSSHVGLVAGLRERGWSVSSSVSAVSLLPPDADDGSSLLPMLAEAVEDLLAAAAKRTSAAAAAQSSSSTTTITSAGGGRGRPGEGHSSRATTVRLSEADSEVDSFCAAVEGVLSHRFKTRQFLLFSVHPWSLVEHAESLSPTSALVVSLARAVGRTDAARLRAWVYAHLNRKTLASELAQLIDPPLAKLLYSRGALLLRADQRERFMEELEPLAGLAFALGRAVGLCTAAGSATSATAGAAALASLQNMDPPLAAAAAAAVARAAAAARADALADDIEAGAAAAVAASAAASQNSAPVPSAPKTSLQASAVTAAVPGVGRSSGEGGRNAFGCGPLKPESSSLVSLVGASERGGAGAWQAASEQTQKAMRPAAYARRVVAEIGAPTGEAGDKLQRAESSGGVRLAGATEDEEEVTAAELEEAERIALELSDSPSETGGSEPEDWVPAAAVVGGDTVGTADASRAPPESSSAEGALTWQQGIAAAAAEFAHASSSAAVAPAVSLVPPPQRQRTEGGSSAAGAAGVVASTAARQNTRCANPFDRPSLNPFGGDSPRSERGSLVGNNPFDSPALSPQRAVCGGAAAAAAEGVAEEERIRAGCGGGEATQDAAALPAAWVGSGADLGLRTGGPVLDTSDAGASVHTGACNGYAHRGGADAGGGVGGGSSRGTSPSLPSAERSSSLESPDYFECSEFDDWPPNHATAAATTDSAAAHACAPVAESSLLLPTTHTRDSSTPHSALAATSPSPSDAPPDAAPEQGPCSNTPGAPGSCTNLQSLSSHASSAQTSSERAALASPSTPSSDPHPANIALANSMRAEYFARTTADQPNAAAASSVGGGGARARPEPGTRAGRLVVRSAVVLGCEMRESAHAKLHTVYRLEARVGPFECRSYRRFSDFVKLHAALKRELPRQRMPRSAQRMLDDRLKPQHAAKPLPKLPSPLSKVLQLRAHAPHPEARLRLLQAYCEDLVTTPELAATDATITFFWPSSERGDGALVAPDGSRAAIT